MKPHNLFINDQPEVYGWTVVYGTTMGASPREGVTSTSTQTAPTKDRVMTPRPCGDLIGAGGRQCLQDI